MEFGVWYDAFTPIGLSGFEAQHIEDRLVEQEEATDSDSVEH